MSATDILFHPPFEKRSKALFGRIDWPVELRRQVIHPSFCQPFAGIRVQLAIGVESFNLRGGTWSPDSKRTDAKLHPRLGRFDRIINATNECVHIFPSPILPAETATRAESLPAYRVREVQVIARPVFLGIRVKIIVEVNSIDV